MDGTADSMIRLEAVSKRYPDGTAAVKGLDLDIPRGSVVMLVGPSGCGKTTTLKMVNRLVEPTSGRILLDGEDVTRIDPVRLRRRIGYVIQQVGLFPHRTVLANVTTVPTLLGWDRARARARAYEMLEMVGLDPAVYGRRYPHELSGGQQQRVGVARALAVDPPVLLMDEPFGAVDPQIRDRLQAEFLRLQREMHKTVMFVTHDLEEAIRLGDLVVVMAEGGRVEQNDTPAAVLGAPASPFVADFVGADRGLKRLSVTTVELTDIDQPVVVLTGEPLSDAGARLRAADARWAVVLDDDGGLRGWLAADQCAGAGVVADRVRRMEAWVPLGSSLKRAFGEMLQHDAGWVAVLDGDRFVGVLTPQRLHEALRRSVEADIRDVAPEEVVVDTVADI